MVSAILTLQGGAIFPLSSVAQQPQGNLINFLRDVLVKLTALVASGNLKLLRSPFIKTLKCSQGVSQNPELSSDFTRLHLVFEMWVKTGHHASPLQRAAALVNSRARDKKVPKQTASN